MPTSSASTTASPPAASAASLPTSPPPAAPTAITIDAVTKRYETPAGPKPANAPPAPALPAAPALDGVSLDIRPGELFFLLGPSGCGKTTLLRIIAGFLEPTAGRVLFQTGDAPPRDMTAVPPARRNTGMVFQSYALWPHMTVAANVAFGLDVRKVSAAEKTRRVNEALDLVQMREYAGRKPNLLSGGQQQRVALARALVIRPDVLLLDEPLSNLDARLRLDLRAEIRRITKASRITAVYVTHDQKEALSMADRMAIMSAGRIVQLGTPAELYQHPANRFVAEFLGETNILPAIITPHVAGSISGSGRVALATPFGDLLSSRLPPQGLTSSQVLISIRPEALRTAPLSTSDPNTLRGTLVETTYLGDVAQHTIELVPTGVITFADATPVRLRIAQLNPARAALSPGSPMAVAVSPDDVVPLPA